MVHWFFKLIKMVQAIFKVFFVGLNSVIEKLNQKKNKTTKLIYKYLVLQKETIKVLEMFYTQL